MRLFVAVDLPDRLRTELQSLLGELEKLGIEARFPRVAGLHLTLKFLGEVSEDLLDQLKQALRAVGARNRRFSLELQGLGCFPSPQRPRVVWVGVRAPQELFVLQRDIEDTLAREGFAREQRAFQPHLTVARLKSGRAVEELRRFLEARSRSFVLDSFEVEAMHLMESRLHPDGAVYRKVETFPLGGDA